VQGSGFLYLFSPATCVSGLIGARIVKRRCSSAGAVQPFERVKASLTPRAISTAPVARSTQCATVRKRSLIARCDTNSATSAYQLKESATAVSP